MADSSESTIQSTNWTEKFRTIPRISWWIPKMRELTATNRHLEFEKTFEVGDYVIMASLDLLEEEGSVITCLLTLHDVEPTR